MERDQDAAQMLETSLQIQELPRTYLNLGVTYFHQGCYADAARTMVKAVDLGLNDSRTWGDLAEAYLMVPELADRAPGAFKQAIALAEEETARSPADAEGRSLLANYYARLQDNEKALAALSEALRLGPNNVNVLFQAALVHEMVGQRDQALETLEAALRAGYSLKEVGSAVRNPKTTAKRSPLPGVGRSRLQSANESAGGRGGENSGLPINAVRRRMTGRRVQRTAVLPESGYGMSAGTYCLEEAHRG
jgi:tetratricopeptide (TPR) repeat protein